MPGILALGMLRQENPGFKVSPELHSETSVGERNIK
jgi:hypothetical protein